MTRPRSVAVIGGGIAGIASAHHLSRETSVTLYEAAPRLGGHARPVEISLAGGGTRRVDSAFIVFNEETYPTFLALLDDWGVRDRVRRAEMSASFQVPSLGLTYALGRRRGTLMGLLDPDVRRILRETWRFRRRASAALDGGLSEAVSLDEFTRGESPLLREGLLRPLTAAIWSMPDADHGRHPVRHLLAYFDHHRLLRGWGTRRWRTFEGTSHQYLEGFQRRFRGVLRLGAPVDRVERTGAGVRLRLASGEVVSHDDAVIATHADTALALLAAPTDDERRLLGAWSYRKTRIVVHTDATVMPRDRRLWSSWNCLVDDGRCRITYCMNRLQLQDVPDPVLVTLDPDGIEPARILDEFETGHPVFTAGAVRAQESLPVLNGCDHVYFAGSYFGHGFHEDASASALAASRALLSSCRASP